MIDKVALKKKWPASLRISRLFRNILSSTFISKDLLTRPAPKFHYESTISQVADKFLNGTGLHNIDVAIAIRTDPKLEHIYYFSQSKRMFSGYNYNRLCNEKCDIANFCKDNPEWNGRCQHLHRHSAMIAHECVACGAEKEIDENKRRRTN